MTVVVENAYDVAILTGCTYTACDPRARSEGSHENVHGTTLTTNGPGEKRATTETGRGVDEIALTGARPCPRDSEVRHRSKVAGAVTAVPTARTALHKIQQDARAREN
ncbi:Hypothetical protein CINCED_3A009307 [Cinara cedri]|uniref:Uncharacterized protein n=1 Tax=Cinara cedri TaxID=506608 RepID=A0A5E4M547_9HEMI|nr:Hypothetical protein CINCED_3A009307 [Cinara cedri]